MSDFKLKTQGGFDLFEVISALQKTIRRGEEKQALFWSMELLPQHESLFWRRIKIIANEDIGALANPQAIILVQVLSEQYFELRKRGDMGALLMVSNAILFLCRSSKSRIADHFICEVVQEREQGILKLEIPDYALDMHTRRGKQKGRGLSHFKEEGAKLSNKDHQIDDPYEERSYELEGNERAKKFSWKKLQDKDKDKEKEGARGPLFE